jgi:hypothetical protein
MSEALRRYTDLSSVIYTLTNKAVTLINPRSWEDTNDSYYLTLYERAKGFSTLLALCFTESSERLHYWRVFAPGPSGVCIEFDRQALIDHATEIDGVRSGNVTYRTLQEMRDSLPTVDELPFVKRYGFEHESEFRFIYASETEEKESLDIDIPLSCITKLTFSPWIHPNVYDSVKTTLKDLPSCSRIRIARSTLIGNEEWKELGDSAVLEQKRRSSRVLHRHLINRKQ